MPKAKKKKINYPICPCCNQAKNRTDMTKAISAMQHLDKIQYPNLDRDFLSDYTHFLDADFAWACDTCFQTKKAELTNPFAQNYCWNPYYAYFDTQHECRNCGTDFTFNKKEKRYWFETLKFWIDSEPVNCPSCRKEIRTLKQENKALSEILRKEESALNAVELQKVIEVYTKWGKTEKSKYYTSLLKK